MRNLVTHYINGKWTTPAGKETTEVINPATEEIIGRVSLGTREDLDQAVVAARDAYTFFSKTAKEDRVRLLEKIAEEYSKRKDDLIEVITEELGAPITLTEQVHYEMGYNHFKMAAEELKHFNFVEKREKSTVVKEPIGVSGLITPWNFPTNQTSTKIASAIAAGSTVVLKPSELTPYSAVILTEIFEAAGVPEGVFNLVNGTGEVVGDGISSHPGIDFVSFTGSAAVGQKVMENGAKTIKNVALELGGKSPLVVLADADINEAAKTAVNHIIKNSGQVCSAATRVLIPYSIKEEFEQAVIDVLPEFPIGNPLEKDTTAGPLVAQKQWDRVQRYIANGIEEGATLLAGGPGKPEGLSTGFYVRPTVFTDVRNNMTIAQEEIFGPVMSIITYETIDQAISIANDTIYGLSGYVVGEDPTILAELASGIRAGQVTVNNGEKDFSAPFGGFKQSGIGREWGSFGIEEYLQPKAIMGL
ncbi:aldehyde dehydrogenase family protein [Virgibacillus kekensis]|uniref:Aldehyde dehydrogenase family protein n=1 Tax=Virgibacillus kekensis TaxID=202261 RepID=A0ABV9DJW9_9BACI